MIATNLLLPPCWFSLAIWNTITKYCTVTTRVIQHIHIQLPTTALYLDGMYMTSSTKHYSKNYSLCSWVSQHQECACGMNLLWNRLMVVTATQQQSDITITPQLYGHSSMKSDTHTHTDSYGFPLCLRGNYSELSHYLTFFLRDWYCLWHSLSSGLETVKNLLEFYFVRPHSCSTPQNITLVR